MNLKIPVFGIMVFFSLSTTQAATVYTDESVFISATGSSNTLVNFDMDFNGDPIVVNTPIDLQYQSAGVDFNPFNGGAPIASDRFALSLPNNLQAVPGSGGGGGFEVIFTNPATDVGLQVGDLQGPSFGDTIFEIFDSSDTSLGSFNLFDEVGDGAFTYLFFGVTSDIPISKLQIAVGAGDNVVFDDFRFQAVPAVPVPAAVWLFGTALVGLIGFGKRKSRIAA